MPPKMNIVRKPGRANKTKERMGLAASSPTTPSGILLKYIRPMLPTWAQYGKVWTCIRLLAWTGQLGLVAVVGYGLFYSMDEERRDRERRQYVYVRDESGQVCDIVRDFQLEAGLRAKKRSKRILDGEEP